MTRLGNGLFAGDQHEDALSVREAELSILQRNGGFDGAAHHMLVVLNNLARTYEELGRLEEALSMRREVYSGFLKLHGKEDERTLQTANNYATSLRGLQRFKEAKALIRKQMPVARRVLGEGHRVTLKTRWNYAMALYEDEGATLDDLREAVTTFEDTERTARRVFGGAHPLTEGAAGELQKARARSREAPHS